MVALKCNWYQIILQILNYKSPKLKIPYVDRLVFLSHYPYLPVLFSSQHLDIAKPTLTIAIEFAEFVNFSHLEVKKVNIHREARANDVNFEVTQFLICITQKTRHPSEQLQQALLFAIV